MKNKNTQKSLTWIACLVLLATFLAFKQPLKQQQSVKDSTPNIIIILTDDQGNADVGFNGCKDIPTPNVNRIASNGVMFTNGYVSYAVCAPSRAGLLTGRYQDRFGYSRNPLYKPFDENIGLPLSEQTMAEYLQQSGYNTMAIGKWHLGVHQKFRPWKRGFNEFYGFLGGGHRYFPEELDINDPDKANNEAQSYRTKLMRNEQVVEETEYLTDAFSREAVSYIERNKQNPFFLYLAYNAPHAPLQATPKYLHRFDNITDPKRKIYAAMVSAVDDGVGSILNKLEELHLSENTIVIFLSDNGGPKQDNASNNGILRGGKGSLFEGGIRVPFAMQWPLKIKPKTTYDKPVISLDIFGTVVANLQKAHATKNTLDGIDLIPFLNGTQKGSPHEYLFWRMYDQKNYAVLHQSGIKQFVLKDSAVFVYNLANDIREQTNVIEKEQNMLKLLEQQRQNWLLNTVPPLFFGLNQEENYNQSQKKKQE